MEDPLNALISRIEALQAKVEELSVKLNAPPPPPSPTQILPKPPRPPLFGGRRTPTRVRDNQTGLMYESKSAVGRALAHEVGAAPTDRFAWYKLLVRFPGRFIEI